MDAVHRRFDNASTARTGPPDVRIVLKYLLLLRGLVIVGQVVALAVIDRVFDFAVPWVPVVTTLVLLAALTLHTWRRLGAMASIPAREFVFQLLADIGALSILVYHTGGSLNPFISLFLLPIIFAAASLPALHTAIVAGAAALAYTVLMFVGEPVHHTVSVQGFDLHIWGMWYGFLLSAACVAAFVARIARVLRERDAALAKAREQALRDERIVALGTLAAGTAHELGTPLATMAILAQDLAADLRDQPTLRAAAEMLQAQIQRCKTSLSQLATNAGQQPADEGFRLTVGEFCEALLRDFAALHPEVAIRRDLRGEPDLAIIPDRTLHQALLNLLNNAAEVSPTGIDIACHWDARELRLEVRDKGPGISREMRAALGRDPVRSPRADGMGLGVYLATTAVQRHGGRVEFHTREGGGTRVDVQLPLAMLGV